MRNHARALKREMPRQDVFQCCVYEKGFLRLLSYLGIDSSVRPAG